MPEVRMATFHFRHGGSVGKPTTFFRWENAPDEDAAFVDYVNLGPAANASVDRSEPSAPVLQFDIGSTTYRRYVGTPGTHWHNTYYDPEDGFEAPARFDVAGYWKCDVYGRPYDLNDLLA